VDEWGRALPTVYGLDQLVEVRRRGGVVVYRARHSTTGQDVALKVLARTERGEELERRLRQECGAQSALSSHPHVAVVLDAGRSHDGQLYVVSAWMAGGSLADDIARTGALRWRRAVRLAGDVADALDAAHRDGLLHRDIKPGNVLFDGRGAVKLAEFAPADLLAGTIAYAAPEVLELHRSSAASDLHSLGATLFEALTGRPPFTRAADETWARMALRVIRRRVARWRPASRSAAPGPPRPNPSIVRRRSRHPRRRPRPSAGAWRPSPPRWAGRSPVLVAAAGAPSSWAGWPPPSRSSPV
jgi:serine/threonine protein kinase